MSTLLAFLVVASTLGLVAPPVAVAAPPVPDPPLITELQVSAGSVSILAGDAGRIEVTARNQSGIAQYNATLVVILPIGITYVPGSSEPGPPRDIGEPIIRTFAPDPENPTVVQQVLTWSNVADLPDGAEIAGSFEVEADNDIHPVGSTVGLDAAVYANADERVVPKILVPPTGPVGVSDATSGGTSAPTVTIVPIRLTKAEVDNAEAEVYRGPANPARYLLTVETATEAGSDGVLVTDLVPAQFQVTDCSLGDLPCTTEIVEVDGEVFTQLTWDLGDVGDGATVQLEYSAFVGLQEITMPEGEPTGAPTRPTGSGYSVTNTATVTGSYTGELAEGTAAGFTVEDSATVTVLDVGIVKTQSGGPFEAGGSRTFSFQIRSSEYITTAGLVVTDTVPDGMCPIVPDGTPTTGTWPDECPTGGGVVTNATMVSAEAHPDGTFTVGFELADLGENQDVTVSYQVYMREFYANGQPTAAGDAFTNTVRLEGGTTPAAGNDVDEGTIEVDNGSSASVGTTELSIAKTVWLNPDRDKITGVSGTTGTTCQTADSVEYVGADGPLLQLGDLVCFRITVSFPSGVATRNAVLTDFLPPGFEFVDWARTPGSTATATRVTDATRWLLGDPGVGGLFVADGQTLAIDLLARVVEVPESQPEVAGNLAKLRHDGAGGTVVAVRDAVDVELAPLVTMSTVKLADGVDSLQVQEQQVVPFTIQLRHDGSAANLNDYPLDLVEVWDVLPPGFGCSTLSGPSPAWASCEDPVGGPSVVKWTLTGTALGTAGLLQAGETATVSYNLTVPEPLSIGTRHTNTAAITRYRAPNTDGIDDAGGALFYPENPVGAYPEVEKNVPEASDQATIYLRGATVVKQVISTSQDVAGNDLTGQATIGEIAVYEYDVTIPSHTSVFSGVLDDALPTGGALIQIGDAVMASTPSGVTVGTGCTASATEFLLCADGRLLFPAGYTNSTAADARFAVRLTVRVADIEPNVHGTNVDNTATFDSAATAGGSPIRQASDDARLSVVEPLPTLTKASSATDVQAGQTVTYTLTARNAAGHPPLYDAVVVDCLSTELAVTTLGPGMTGPTPGDDSNGCPSGTQRLQWTLPGPLVAGTDQSVLYIVTIPGTAAAGKQYRNDAALTGSSLPGAAEGERTTYRADANRTITVNNPGLTKSAAPGVVVPGQQATWTVAATLPPNVWLYNTTLIDRIPSEFGNASNVQSWELSCTGGDAAWQSSCVTGDVIPASPESDFGVTVGSIAPSATVRTLTLTIRATLPAEAAASVSNDTTVTNTVWGRWNHSDKGAPDDTAATFDSERSATASLTVRHPAVSVTKSVDDTTVEQGQVFTYTVNASASSAADRNLPAYHVQVVDTVPAGIVVLGAGDVPLADGGSTPSGGVWNDGARTLTWTIATLNPGTPNARSFTYRARLAPAAQLTGAALANTVRPQSWQSLESGGGTYGPGAAATASVTPQFPRINTAKTQVPPANPVYIGQEVTFRFTLTNAGGATAASLDAVDTLPANWSYVPGSAQVTVRGGPAVQTEPTSITGQVLRWDDIGGAAVNLLTSQQIVVTYRAVASSSVTVGATVAHTNTAVAADVTDTTGGTSYNGGAGSYIGTSGTATARIHLSDVAATKVANDNFVAGQTGTFTITVRNNGPDPAVGVHLVDTVTAPAGVTVLGAENAAAEGWTCTSPNAAGEFSCDRATASEQLASGASWTLTVSAAVAATVPSGTTIPNTVTVSSRTEDRTLTNNTGNATATVRASADLAVTKTAAPSPVTAGTSISWTITLVNNGPSVSRGSVATPIVLADTLPTSQVSGIAIGSQTPGAGCAIAAGALRCEIAHDLAVAESVVVTLTGTVNDSVAPGSTIANTATVTPVTTDPAPANNNATSSTPTAVQESLTITKAIVDPEAPVPPTPGETITYRLEVHNGGPSIARGVYVVDTLPAGLTFDEIVGGDTGWSATPGGGNTVRLDLAGTLGVGADSTVEIRAEIASSVTGDFTNTAAVSSTWRADQDTAEVTTGSAPEADLGIEKSVSPSTVVAGAAAGGTYTLVVTNHGPSDAAAPVTVTDLLPVGMSVRGSLPSACSQDEVGDRVEITCVDADGLEAGETWTITIGVQVAADVTATSLSNTATVSSPTPDPDLDNNTSTVPVDIAQRARLEVTKSGAPDPVTAGEDVTWTIEVTNRGPSDAQFVQLEDLLDPRLTLVSVDPDSGCTGTTTIHCGLGTIAAGDTVEVTIVTTVLSSVPDDETIENTATATSTTLDPDTGEPATDDDTDDVTVETLSNLTIAKTATTPSIDAGGIAGFDIVVGNDGPSDAAADVVVTDTLPAGMTYLASATVGGPAEWACEAAGQVVTCTLELGEDPVSLPAGATAPTLHLDATVSASLPADSLTNTVTVTSPSEPTPPTDEEDVTVTTHADLGIVKSHDPETPAVAGTPFEWTIEVTNHGLSDSVATAGDPIVIRDVLPDGVTLADDPVSGGPDTTCAVVDEEDGREVVECERTATLVAGDSFAVTLAVVLDEALSGLVQNTATVAPGETPQPDANVNSDSSTDEITITETADLTIAKAVTTDPVVAGNQISWTVTVTNLGPSDSNATAADPIRVVDTLPAGVHSAAGSGEGWTCSPLAALPDGRERIECLLPTTLTVADAAPITVTATVGSAVQGQITNVAVVTPGLTVQPPGGETDEATATSPVSEVADLSLVKTIAEDIVAGATGVYRIQVSNSGPSDARNAVVVDTLPEGLGFSRVLPPADGEPAWSCEPATDDPQQVECELDGDLAASDVVTFDLEVTAVSDLQGDVENIAVVSAETPDPDEENNDDSVSGTIAELTDLSIVKIALNDPVVGGELTYELTVRNAGPSVARGVAVTDTLPAQLSLVSVSAPEPWLCSTGEPGPEGTPVTCVLDELVVGDDPGAITIVASVTPDAYPAISNTAQVAAATPEGQETLEDNTSTVTSPVPSLAELAITKELTGPLSAGRTGSYRIVVTNHGPTPDPGPITVVDELPEGLTVRSWSIDLGSGSCEGSGRRLTCTLDGLGVDESAEITLVVSVASDARGTLVNTATVTSPAFPEGATAAAAGVVDTSMLPNTGGSPAPLLWALLLVLLGGLVVAASRRRDHEA